MILHIDTKDRKQISVSLKKGGKILKTLSAENKYGSQVLLPLIMKLLNSTGSPIDFRSHIGNIDVETGPGSFTGLRVGVSVANALGYSLGIPVNGKKMETDLLY